MKRITVRFILACLVLFLFGGRAVAGPTDGRYVLGADDVLDISVPSHSDIDKDLDRTVVILPDGTITYPEVGDIKAAGKTTQALAQEIETVLRKTRKNVHVVISVHEIHSRQCRIVGAVQHAGSYAVKPDWRLMDIVALAGGLTVQPAYVTGRMIRADGSVVPIDINAAIQKPDSDANAPVKVDDLILLDQREIHNQVHVIGQVARPGAYDLMDGLNVIALLSEAGSPTPRAALRKTYVLRNGQQIPLDLYPTLAEGKADPAVSGFAIKSGDVLFVPETQVLVAVMGQVKNPGYFPLPERKEDATILKMLSDAGGQLPEGDLRHAGIVRWVGARAVAMPFNIDDMLKKGKLADNIVLQPGDILFVPTRTQPKSLFELTAPLALLAQFGLHL